MLNKSIVNSIIKAVEFLESCQEADGYWREFEFAPGYSDIWVTATVGDAIA
ncbi:MAG: hypothetical protein O4861_09230 [Trichodesmium sp. St16_bin4-tuft]|nr:hypothetical protein [Trichodesmium sp. MAG_R01]MDE5070317.1 hypothetical protein [Trichodesmium sp. St4_bin8_1]MDE5098504.1 hypothetical protein [Trichodesmium sp. St16_bin4-tuft]